MTSPSRKRPRTSTFGRYLSKPRSEALSGVCADGQLVFGAAHVYISCEATKAEMNEGVTGLRLMANSHMAMELPRYFL